VTGRRYLLRATTVPVTCAWNGRTSDLPPLAFPYLRTRPSAPHNVQLLLPDGSLIIRPFRGLARLTEGPQDHARPPSS